MRTRSGKFTGRPVNWPLTLALVTVLVWVAGCAAPARHPASGTFGGLPFLSRVTVTGSDVPGPLRIREARLRLSEGEGAAEDALHVPMGGPLTAVLTVWMNGHGEFVGRWERDGEVVDRLRVFLTYGETLEVTLAAISPLALDRPGEHTLRFVVESPAAAVVPPELHYTVGLPH
ncbi:MAG: hypothetical protein OEW11_06795 [Nitrospirota bacterium]|nr:hypothetical protein [Nitrospirota bacterium]